MLSKKLIASSIALIGLSSALTYTNNVQAASLHQINQVPVKRGVALWSIKQPGFASNGNVKFNKNLAHGVVTLDNLRKNTSTLEFFKQNKYIFLKDVHKNPSTKNWTKVDNSSKLLNPYTQVRVIQNLFLNKHLKHKVITTKLGRQYVISSKKASQILTKKMHVKYSKNCVIKNARVTEFVNKQGKLKTITLSAYVRENKQNTKVNLKFTKLNHKMHNKLPQFVQDAK